MEDKELYLFDLDGTLILGNRVIDGAIEAINKIREQGKKLVIFTNNSSRTRMQYVEKLAKLDLIEIKSLNKDYASYDSVVLVGENEDENMKNSFEVKEKNIISKLKSEKKYLVAVQREESTSEFIKLCSDLNISTIDNIDSEVGKISLTMLVKDESKVGNYGVGENTTDLMPFSK